MTNIDPDARYERVNDITAVSIRLASPTDIRNWSYGEVRKPETINYRTYRPEKDGLFCERIFGPKNDYECFCGKYKGIKHKGIVCDRCGVKITHSRERRTRMGHITLAAKVAHIWFFKAMPSRLGALLGMKASDLEKVIYFQDYVVIDPGNADQTKLEQRQILTEDQYRGLRERGLSFEAGMGAEAVHRLLSSMDLKRIEGELREELSETRSKQKQKDLIKRLKTVNDLESSGNRPEWMILDVVPVIPPELRPLVLLESGNFASSDLNDLYRRLINRNNRLKKFLDLNAPEVIIRNEKRMLQQSVDALFDNGRCKRPVLGSSNRPLKSLTDMIKGKQGRFRENLLGKRVDYSGRSVIVVGPDLKLHQCGLPKKIALELFQPFIIRRLRELGLADTIRSAKKMLERRDEQVWDILEEVIQNHPVLLNRAPTLHRIGIQAFEPVLIEGNAIRIHPLVCTGFNADFDGDQMAVHLPLSLEAQVEARTLMLSTNNIFSPANGRPIMAPTQDVVLGCAYLTANGPGTVEITKKTVGGKDHEYLKSYASPIEVFRAHGDLGRNGRRKAQTHQKIRIRVRGERTVVGDKGEKHVTDGWIETTVGRVIFDDILPKGMPFYNRPMDKKTLQRVITDCDRILGTQAVIKLLDDLKALGFKASTAAGLSFGKDDILIPHQKKDILARAQREVEEAERQREAGAISDKERYDRVVDTYTKAKDDLGHVMMDELKAYIRPNDPYKNPIHLMADSGARGSVTQVLQLAGMRGLMAKPNGDIIETPIKSNFREGLNVLEYFSSTHGARKGLADTALKTADSGYLTRKLADVTQNVVITMGDCGTSNGVQKAAVIVQDKVAVPLSQQLRGRVAVETIEDVVKGEVVVRANEMITDEAAAKLEALDLPSVKVRTPMTCEAPQGLCTRCYGMDLSRKKLVEVGTAVGVIAAQSIGEPGTQLTMRTFHIGGTATRAAQEREIVLKKAGTVKFAASMRTSPPDAEGRVTALTRNGVISVVDARGVEVETFAVPLGATMLVKDGEEIPATDAKKGRKACEWDPHTSPIIANVDGVVHFEDIVEDVTMKVEQDPGSKKRRMLIKEQRASKDSLHPQILLRDKSGKTISQFHLPELAEIEVKDGQTIRAGTLLAKRPRSSGGTQDITSGLPRVTELFENRQPKDPAVLAETDGMVTAIDRKRNKRTIVITNQQTGEVREHLVPQSKYLKVHVGDTVHSGEALVEGPLYPQDVLRISGVDKVQEYLLDEVQKVYRAQGVAIDDKHIEIIVSQMLRKVKVVESGDSDFLPGNQVDRAFFKREALRIREAQGKPPVGEPLLLGITKAALQSDSFISAASFQETTKVLTQAAMAGKRDSLMGLKENVILGHLIPAGTGFTEYHRTVIKHQFENGGAAGASAS